ncbi:ras-like protein [Anaeramoeba flamelloides]|uniref:Ras-like protein n=1 Tax=Anaeramoeba flamelloides TaxID=1746091 RepID=A0AAV7Z652_9EUKA|nr:ras-like protein [Anaeramoeba flamelloides]
MSTQEVHKIVLVGGGAVGKTALSFRFIQGKFVEDYDPTIEERYRKVIVVDDKACLLMIMDTAGQEEFSTVKDRYFKEGEGFVVVFSLIVKSTIEEARKFHQRIVRHKGEEDAITVTCGNKCDLEDDRVVDSEDGEQLADEFNSTYFETSALTRQNVNETFYELVRKIRKFKLTQIPEENETDEEEKTKKKKWFCAIL